VLVVVTGLLLGYYGWLSLAAPPFPSYRADFTGAQWIRSVEGAPDTFFRKRIFISGEIEQAWIQISATDCFRLFINNVPIHNPGESGAPTWTACLVSAKPTLIWDISKFLKQGTNAIAVEVLRSTYPGAAEVLVRGLIRLKTNDQPFVSDSTWKATGAPGMIANLVPWTDPDLDENQWPAAVKEADADPGDRLIQPVFVPPDAFESAFEGKWLVDPQFARNQAGFVRHFDLVPGTRQAWLEVAANGDYTVTLNGRWLGDFSRSEPALQFVYLTPFLRAGGNDLAIRVRVNNQLALLLAEVAMTDVNGKLVAPPLGTDDSWSVVGDNVRGSEPAQEIGRLNYAGDHWGVPPRLTSVAGLSYPEGTRQTLKGWFVLLITAAGVLILWRLLSGLLGVAKKYQPGEALSFDALTHLPVLLLTAVLLLLRFDVRLRPESAIRLEFFFCLLLLLVGVRLVLWVLPGPRHAQSAIRQRRRAAGRTFCQKYGFALALTLIVLFGFGLRLYGINSFPLDQDDIFMRSCTKGIFQRGYPSIDYGGVPLRLTTYELVPYPMALSALVFGWSDWAMRVPALLFGTLTIFLIGRMGRMLFNRWVGLFAALIYACLPWTVFWALHCFHPSQAQFFAVLSITSFYAAIRRPGRIDKKHFGWTCFFFCFTFLSWEGTGFLLIAFTAALLLLHPGRWGWLRQGHVWAGLIVVGSVVVLQFASRTMALPPYLALGYGLADLGNPTLYFLNPQCQPFYYLSEILLIDPYLLLTICFCLCLLWIGKSKAFRYCVIVYFTLLLSYSILLPAYAQRYGYYYQAILIIGACAAVFECGRRLSKLMMGRRWFFGRLMLRGTVFAGAALLFVATTNVGLMFYRLSEGRQGQAGMRYSVRWQDSASSARYVQAHWQPGDTVIADLTQAFELYGGRLPDFATDTLLGSRIVYDRKRPIPHYEHRITNIPIVMTIPMVEQVMQRSNRVWYVTTYEPGSTSPMADTVAQLLTRRSRIVYSCYSSLVYLWQGFLPVPPKIIPNPALPPHPALPDEYKSLVKSATDPGNPPYAQFPFKQPLKPNEGFYEGDGLDVPRKPESPIQDLMPAPSSIKPPRRPSPSPSAPILRP
jgi:hypothetical protein